MLDELRKFTTEVELNAEKQLARFEEKQGEDFEGWDDASPKLLNEMLGSASNKLFKLNNGGSEDPAKDCADVCNFALFFKVIHGSG